MKAIWITDIHLEFLSDRQQRRFFLDLNNRHADCVLISGDIGLAPSVAAYLTKMEVVLQCPIYFVLGNHDFYHGSIAAVRSQIREVARTSHHLRWLNECGVARLSENTVLIGHDGWGDGRLGDFYHSDVELNDFHLIQDLAGLTRGEIHKRIQTLGEQAASHFRTVLPEALSSGNHIVVVTHVPPFLEAAWHEGRYCNADWLPFFSCGAAGEVLKEAMREHPQKRMTVLCGHTHSEGTSRILPNVVAYTGAAEYGRPWIQNVFEWD